MYKTTNDKEYEMLFDSGDYKTFATYFTIRPLVLDYLEKSLKELEEIRVSYFILVNKNNQNDIHVFVENSKESHFDYQVRFKKLTQHVMNDEKRIGFLQHPFIMMDEMHMDFLLDVYNAKTYLSGTLFHEINKRVSKVNNEVVAEHYYKHFRSETSSIHESKILNDIQLIGE